MDQRSWFNQLYRNEPPGPMIPNNAPPMPMEMGGGGMVGYEPQQVQNPIGAFDDPIRLGMSKLRKSEIKPTEYVASATKPDVLEHAKVDSDSKSLLDSHIKSLADHANAGMSVSSDNNRLGSIEDMYGLNVYRPKSTGEKVMDFIGGFAPTVIAGLGSMADPDNGAYGLGSMDAALKQLNYYQTQAQNDKNKALDIRAGLLKDDDLLGAYGKTVNAYQSPNPPSMEVDRYLMQQLMQNQAIKKTPADFQPYLLSHYDPQTGQYDFDKAVKGWSAAKESNDWWKPFQAQMAIDRYELSKHNFDETLKQRKQSEDERRLSQLEKRLSPAQGVYQSISELEGMLGSELEDYDPKKTNSPGVHVPGLGFVPTSFNALKLDDSIQRILNTKIKEESGLNQTMNEVARQKKAYSLGKLNTEEQKFQAIQSIKRALAADMRNTEAGYSDVVETYSGVKSSSMQKSLDFIDDMNWAKANPNNPTAREFLNKYKLK